MLNFKDILKVYPKRLHAFKENILKNTCSIRYWISFSNNLASKLVFLGGTAIRNLHNSTRFSKDLDFDNLGLPPSDFTKITQQIKYQLELDGYSIEIKDLFRSPFCCSMKFPGLLFENRFSGYKEEKILIRLDSELQQYTYTPDKYLLKIRYLQIYK